jgi:hypothetical protein
MTGIMDAYIKGRIAAMSHLSKKELDANIERPANPYARNQHVENIEWTRGFQEVIAQGYRGGPSSNSSVLAEVVGDEEANALDEELEFD